MQSLVREDEGAVAGVEWNAPYVAQGDEYVGVGSGRRFETRGSGIVNYFSRAAEEADSSEDDDDMPSLLECTSSSPSPLRRRPTAPTRQSNVGVRTLPSYVDDPAPAELPGRTAGKVQWARHQWRRLGLRAVRRGLTQESARRTNQRMEWLELLSQPKIDARTLITMRLAMKLLRLRQRRLDAVLVLSLIHI